MDPRPFKLLSVCIVFVLDLLEDGFDTTRFG